ncbi:MAG: hypothetical protein AMK69_02755 [Nitrospira bacterium SG8_3]|nr:MAG: hypothetical protein AMK69_02755 [Nitrospira bacterium SG8_3]
MSILFNKGAKMFRYLMLVLCLKHNYNHMETLEVIARSHRRRSNLLEPREELTFTKWDCFASLAMTSYAGLIYAKNFLGHDT